MSVIEGDELKPWGGMDTRTDKDGRHINLRTRCNHPMCQEGCFDGKGDCKDYIPMKRISGNIRYIASLIEKREYDL